MQNIKIAIIGLGYVGLPLAIEFGKKYRVIAYDINQKRIQELQAGVDHTREADLVAMRAAVALNHANPYQGLSFTTDEQELKTCNTYIVTVPTPITKNNTPDLAPLVSATEVVARSISKGNTVIYESTTYPGCTEEDCIPIIEKISRLRYNQDFFAGYSPERVNPGDKANTLTRIKKITSGSTPEAADRVDALYASIIQAGTHKAPSIRVAEAAKIIENAQRDLNISFVNELALIFDRMGIDTRDVIEAAATKWNFVRYSPGLVGGHCISVDPYYLASKAASLGHTPQVILSGRHVNNSIAPFIVGKVMKLMIQKDHKVKGANLLMLGITFKENCPDLRNTKIVDIYRELKQFGVEIDVFDPWVNGQELRQQYGIEAIREVDPNKSYQAIILAVAHREFQAIDFQRYHQQNTMIFDVKAAIDRRWVDGRL